MKIVLKDKKTEPSFKYYVKLNTPCFDYYVFDDFEQAMNKARVLSLTEFPIVVVMEPDKDKNGEWMFIQTFIYIQGRCQEDDKKLLHVKFYLDAGECLNYKSISEGE